MKKPFEMGRALKYVEGNVSKIVPDVTINPVEDRRAKLNRSNEPGLAWNWEPWNGRTRDIEKPKGE